MTEPRQTRKSALRDVGGWMFLTAVLMVFGLAPESFWSNPFFRGDVVAAAFRWFFTTFTFYPALAALGCIAYVVERRVKQGDPLKEDLNLVLTIVSILVTIFDLIPSSFRDRLYSSLYSWLYSQH